MIKRLVAASLATPLWVAALVAVIIVGGTIAYENLDIEAYPDPVAPEVEIITQPLGLGRRRGRALRHRAAGDGPERHAGARRLPQHLDLRALGHQVLLQLGHRLRWDRQEVLNRLQLVQLPNNLQPGSRPRTPSARSSATRSPRPATTQRDQSGGRLGPRAGVQAGARASSTSPASAALTKQYHVDVDPYRLKGHGLSLQPLIAALQNANQNVGGNILPLGEQAFNVRGLGLIKDLQDIRNVTLSEQKGVPIRVGDVADVEVGHATRLGIVGKDTDPDVVEGIVLMRRGGDTLKTLEGVRKKVDEIRSEHLLPPGMDIKPYYDRTDLVHLTTHTVFHNLFEGMFLVVLVLLLFLSNFRAALITALQYPARAADRLRSSWCSPAPRRT